jgi:arachidonate 15-lipoxygenase
VAQDGGRVVGFGEAGGISTLDYLIDAAALIVFTAGVQHAAVNFPQFDLMSYTPNMPLAGYAPAPASTSGHTEQDFLDLLPPLEMASLQLAVLYELGTVHYTTLGEYGPRYFSDPRVQPALAAFQQELDQIGALIDERNLSRRPYEFLARAGIPQSVNI